MIQNEQSVQKFANFFSKFGKEVHFRKGESIIRPEDTPTEVYFVKTGYIRIYAITSEGVEKIHIIYKPHDIFPLMWVLRNEQKKLYYEAMEDVTLIKMKKEAFLKIVNPDLELISALLYVMTSSFSVFSDRIDDLEVSKTYPRIVSCLIFLAKHYGNPFSTSIKTSDGYIISAPVTQQDIANFSSMTRETVSREMSVLEKKKIITYKKHLIVINSIKNLENELLKSAN